VAELAGTGLVKVAPLGSTRSLRDIVYPPVTVESVAADNEEVVVVEAAESISVITGWGIFVVIEVTMPDAL
jgi:hypothetical protein